MDSLELLPGSCQASRAYTRDRANNSSVRSGHLEFPAKLKFSKDCNNLQNITKGQFQKFKDIAKMCFSDVKPMFYIVELTQKIHQLVIT